MPLMLVKIRVGLGCSTPKSDWCNAPQVALPPRAVGEVKLVICGHLQMDVGVGVVCGPCRFPRSSGCSKSTPPPRANWVLNTVAVNSTNPLAWATDAAAFPLNQGSPLGNFSERRGGGPESRFLALEKVPQGGDAITTSKVPCSTWVRMVLRRVNLVRSCLRFRNTSYSTV